jgi:hypothetical protein
VLISGLHRKLDRHLLVESVGEIVNGGPDEIADATPIDERCGFEDFELAGIDPHVDLTLWHGASTLVRRCICYSDTKRKSYTATPTVARA